MATTMKISSADNPDVEALWKLLYNNFCQHLVCLAVRYSYLDEKGKSDGFRRLAHYTFFVVSVGNQWFLVTSGHVLRDLDKVFQSDRVRVEYCLLADFFGERKKVELPTPFPYPSEPHFFEDNDDLGLDFGFIPLREWYKSGLQHNGILPLTEAQWRRTSDPPVCAYWVLGFPQDVNESRNPPLPAEDKCRGTAAPVMVSLEPVSDTSVLPDSVPLRETQLPRFIGRINTDIDFRVEGMSGGPIFGLVNDPEGYYILVAMQNSWHAPSRTVFGCPVRVIGAVLTEYVARNQKAA
jgi:hypothetical protein